MYLQTQFCLNLLRTCQDKSLCVTEWHSSHSIFMHISLRVVIYIKMSEIVEILFYDRIPLYIKNFSFILITVKR